MDSAVTRETDQSTGKTHARAATGGDEVIMKESTLQYLEQWMGWGRSFWFHSPVGAVTEQAVGVVMWPVSEGHTIYQDGDQGRAFRRVVVEGHRSE